MPVVVVVVVVFISTVQHQLVSGYPATVTAVDIIDTMYLFIDLFISVRCF